MGKLKDKIIREEDDFQAKATDADLAENALFVDEDDYFFDLDPSAGLIQDQTHSPQPLETTVTSNKSSTRKPRKPRKQSDLQLISGLTGYRLREKDLEKLKKREAEGEKLSSDEVLHLRITRDLLEIVDRVRKGINNLNITGNDGDETQKSDQTEQLVFFDKKFKEQLASALRREFGKSHDRSKKEALLKPAQSAFIKKFFETTGNWGLALRTGIGKTRTFLEIANIFLQNEPGKFVIITTPLSNLVRQIEEEIQAFSSLAPLAQELTNIKKLLEQSVSDEEYEAFCLANQKLSDHEFQVAFNKHFSSHSRLIIGTPHRLGKLIEDNKIPAEKVGLLIFDEGGVGGRSQTCRYPTFPLYSKVKETNPNIRLISADATPSDFEFFQDKFDIEKWEFGDDPNFLAAHTNQLLETRESPDHQKLSEQLYAIKRSLFDRLTLAYASLVQSKLIDEDLEAELKELKLYFIGQDQPRLTYKQFEESKKLAKLIRSSKFDRNLSDLLKNFTELLHSAHRLQRLIDVFDYQTYGVFLKKVRDLLRIPRTNEQWKERGKHLIMGAEPEVDPLKSPLWQFAEGLKNSLEEHDKAKKPLEHPKTEQLKEILLELLGKRRKVMVICDYLETANDLRRICQEQWKINCGMIRGGSDKVKNELRQQFLFNQFALGDIQVIFSTPVAERGLDLPDLDNVITYSPSKNFITEVQTMGRLRKGGVTYTICASSEKTKYFSNQRQKKRYLEQRSQYLPKANTDSLPVSAGEALSKFSGRRKVDQLADQLTLKDSIYLNQIISERFTLLDLGAIETRHPAKGFRGARTTYSFQILLADSSGIIRLYYSFHDINEAKKAKVRLQESQNQVVIVNARLKLNKAGTSTYLTATHNPYYLQESVLACPQEDSDPVATYPSGRALSKVPPIVALRYRTWKKAQQIDDLPPPFEWDKPSEDPIATAAVSEVKNAPQSPPAPLTPKAPGVAKPQLTFLDYLERGEDSSAE